MSPYAVVSIVILLVTVTAFAIWQLYAGAHIYFSHATTISIEMEKEAPLPIFGICMKIWKLYRRSAIAKYCPDLVANMGNVQELRKCDLLAKNLTLNELNEATLNGEPSLESVVHDLHILNGTHSQNGSSYRTLLYKDWKCFEYRYKVLDEPNDMSE